MGHKKVHQGSFKFSFITNQAFYIGGKITLNIDARRIGTILNCCNRKCGGLRLALLTGTDSVNLTVMFKHVTATNYK